VVRVPAVPLPGYPSFRLGLPSRRVRAALIRHRAEVVHLASPVFLGALAADVERVQLPAATALRPEVASVVVGINDTLRGDFDPERTGASVDRTVAALRSAGAQVLTARLPDPGQMFGLPRALARPLARRMRAVNAAVDEVARRHGTVHLDAARDPPPTSAAGRGRAGRGRARTHQPERLKQAFRKLTA
jgi:GDSL-like Lipase/Acylhydrolase family